MADLKLVKGKLKRGNEDVVFESSLINPNVIESINDSLNQISNATLNDWHVVNGFNIQLPPGKYLIEFQTSIQASMSGTGIAQPMVQLRTNVPTNTMVGYALLGNTINTSNTSSWSSVSGSFYYEQLTATSVLTMMIRLATVSGNPTITGLYARTNFPANSGYIRATKIA